MQFLKNKIFLVTLLFIYIPGLVVADATLDSSDSGVEKLLNSLAKANSQKAKSIKVYDSDNNY